MDERSAGLGARRQYTRGHIVETLDDGLDMSVSRWRIQAGLTVFPLPLCPTITVKGE
jgi:hypothetical protein